jgi:hypothetical protein
LRVLLSAGASVIATALTFAADGDGGNRSEQPFTAEQIQFYEAQVQPILKTRCLKCHGDGPKIRAGFRLDSRAAVVRGGDLGPAVSTSDPGSSRLLRAIRYADEELEMPPAGKLPAAEIAILTRWVKEGLPFSPASAPTANAPVADRTAAVPKAITPRDRWSLGPVSRPRVPHVKNASWCRNPIDAFVAARLQCEGLEPAPEADRVTLIRRLSYDVSGLPPSPQDVDAFAADAAPDAYERLVDRLLASPHYGEKWGRHWLDLVRYAETNGYERDAAKPFVWRYRDYVIAAFNHDKSFDEFVREQLAGDQIAPQGAESLIATGYYHLGIWDDEPADRELARFDGLDGVITTTGQVFLGMTINCARCHDHKVDPIPQRDYYRLLAFFRNLAEPNWKHPKKAVNQSGEPVEVMCVEGRGHADTFVLLRGNPNLHGEKVEPGIPAILVSNAASPSSAGDNRRSLADWLTGRQNPRTARVMANRLWQHHFGRGIVPTPNDFGGLGEPPSHPELLDWLAAELTDGGWRLKRIHKLILYSSAYRMSSRGRDQALVVDPGNYWFSRFPMRRLTAEEIRDSILSVSGSLNTKPGGPSIYPPIPSEVLAGQSMPGHGWPVSSLRESARRSVYVHVKRSLLVPILANFDAADTDLSCPVRYTTTVPTQALGLLNGAFSNQEAARFARRLETERPRDLEAQVRHAIRLTTGKNPTAAEVTADIRLIKDLETAAKLDRRAALTQYCLLALNANAFLYVD